MGVDGTCQIALSEQMTAASNRTTEGQSQADGQKAVVHHCLAQCDTEEQADQ